MASEIKPSRIYIHCMRIARMKEICEDKFGESFLSVQVKLPDRIFIVRVADDADIKKMEQFTSKYKHSIIEVFPRMAFSVYRGKKQLVPANKK